MKLTAQRFISAATTGAIFLSVTLPTYAQGVSLCPQGSDFGPLCTKNYSANSLVYFIVTILLISAVVLSLIFLIWGGIKWILSGGDKAKVEGARSQIIGALIGLAVAFAAFFLLNIVANLFLGRGINGFNLPTLK